MGSYDYDTQRTNSAGVGHKNNNHAATEVAETEEVKHLKSQYKNDLTKLQELFTAWSEADLLFALQENQGDLEQTIARISEGHIAQWGEVKSRKSKKEHSSKNKQSGQQFGNAQRGQRGSDRGRTRGEGGRGGRSNDRTRGSRRENGSGYNRPPRQQNGTNSSNYDDTNNLLHGKARSTNNTNNSKNNSNDSIEGNWGTENVTGDWSADISAQGGSWSENPAENNKGSWANDSTDAQGSGSKENPTNSSQSGWNADNTTENKDSMDNISASRDIDKATDNLKHNRDSNITKDNWDTEHSKDNWSVENDSLTADTPKDNWGSDNLGADTTKNSKVGKEISKSPNTVMRSVAPTKSPVSHSLRTIPSKPKASWAQIVKPESKPEPKPEPISTPTHKSPETVKPVSPQISKSPNPIQSPPAPKVTESVIVPPPQETLTTTTKTEEMKEYVREITSPETATAATSITSSTPVVNVSPLTKEVSPPGLHKTKTGTATRRLKQDTSKQETPVVMPSTGAGLERIGVQFGSLSISNNNVEESSETETQIVPQVQKTEERSSVSVETSPQPQTTPIQQQQIVPQQALQQQVTQQQVVNQQATQQLQQQAAQQLQQLQHQPPQSAQPQSSALSQSNSINRLPTTSAQTLPSSVGSAPTGTPANPTLQNFNPSYFKQDQSSAAYLNQQHHLGLATEPLNAPYASYLPNQPPNQLSGFGIGPIQSIPEYNAMYGPDAQRLTMGYYDPTYGQASPVTSTGYQARDNKYTSDTATNNNTNSQTTNQQSTSTQQPTNQQGGQNPQQAYPLGVPYYPYYYMANQFPSAYQQSGYGQPFVNKSIYPMYNHPHSTKPGSASGASPYSAYPTTPTTPNTPHHYSHTSNTGYDEVSAAQMHHHPGVPSVLDYQKPYNSVPPLNFLGNAGNNPQPATANTNSTGGKSSNNGSTELNPSSTQYKTYQDKTSANAQSAGGVGQTGAQQHQQPTNPNYYGQQQAQQMFNNYQHPQTHHQYYQAHHQATNRNQQQYWSQS